MNSSNRTHSIQLCFLRTLAVGAWQTGCSDGDAKTACAQLLSCGQKLSPALEEQCQASYDQVRTLSDGEQQCRRAMTALGEACTSSNGATEDGGRGEGGAASCVGIGKSQGASEACCLSYGVDACGAGLFCAAFDGRTQPTCYPERSRADLASCNADVQCTSGSCNTSAGKCRSLPSMPCEVEVGCAPDPSGEVHVAYFSNGSTAIKYAKRSAGSWKTWEVCDTFVELPAPTQHQLELVLATIVHRVSSAVQRSAQSDDGEFRCTPFSGEI